MKKRELRNYIAEVDSNHGELIRQLTERIAKLERQPVNVGPPKQVIDMINNPGKYEVKFIADKPEESRNNIIKRYEYVTAERTFLSKQCPECSGELIHNGYKPGTDGWVSYYRCTKCNKKFQFEPSDMGQTLPSLEQIESFNQ